MLSNVARSLRLTRREIMLQIDFPAALPKIMVGVRIAVALAILVSVSAEMLLSTDGMGYFIVRAQQQFRIGRTRYTSKPTIQLSEPLHARQWL